MEIIITEKWNYQLVKNGEEYVFSVLCGSAATFEIEVKLNASQIADFQKYGKVWCDDFSKEIRQNAKKF